LYEFQIYEKFIGLSRLQRSAPGISSCAFSA